MTEPDQDGSERAQGAAVLLVHEPEAAQLAGELLARLRRAGFEAASHALSAAAMESDRRARVELDGPLEALAARPGVARGRLGVLGLGRGGTLAFLLGCTRRLGAVVDVDGPLLYPSLSAERPIQPLELTLNLEGGFLGLFAARGPVGAEQRELVRTQLVASARPFELALVAEAGPGFLDARTPGYDAARAGEAWTRALGFLRAHLAAEDA